MSHVDELIARKTSGPEKAVIEDAVVEFHTREYQRLTTELEAARDASKLPDEPLTRDALNDLLIRLRLGQLGDAP